MTNSNEEESLMHPPNENTALLSSSNEDESLEVLKDYIKPIFASFFISIVAGLNDGSLGLILPNLKEYYDISDKTISLLFLYSACGFFTSALLNGYIVHRLGQLKTMYLGAGMMLISYSFLMMGFSFSVMKVAIVFTGAGMALLDAAVNVYMANIPHATFMLNVLHSVYGIGAMIGPLVAVTLLQFNISWKGMYVFLALCALVNIISITIGFYHTDFEEVTAVEVAEPVINEQSIHASKKDSHAELTRAAIFNRMTMVGAANILVYVGAEVTMGGWGYTFLLEGRHGDKILMGRVMAGYWGALAGGRIVLGYLSGRYGEKLMITLFTMGAIGSLVLMMITTDIILNATVVVLVGFLLGPMFPTTIALASRVLPRKYHATSIGFMAALGAGGAALFPFIVGQIAGELGIVVMPAAVIALATIMMVLWAFIPSDRPFFVAFS
ncbi:hypothetical protein K7432_010384 [Basidiobolus ranarum]|uniref:Major facilitator superfamily (MFS) profile domain-containing protein n=1 Tax=Basidiobolus ranarum TaxID=34480 RepID=A0ABR2VVI1_9FUNG